MMKRTFDVIISMAILGFGFPVLAILCFLGYFFIGSGIFFFQVRPGKSGKPFNMIKFRSMTSAKDADGNLLPDDQRLTPFGVTLRSTSLDELPSLWSVLKGDMSLVGPRPLLMEYLPLYSTHQARRHEVKPGITGWAQVNGRNAISWKEKFELDVWYVDNQSLWLDIKILLLTLKKVFVREGISAAGEATMTKFTGSSGND
jgi:sugar transferase EpsL